MKPLSKQTAHWIALGIVTLACIAILNRPSPPYKENTGYHTVSRHWLEGQNQLSTKEYLTIGRDRFTQSTIESMNGKTRNATLSAEVIRTDKNGIQLKITNVKLSQDTELFAIEKTPELFFRRQYAFQEGSIITHVFLPSNDEKAICYYILEFKRTRCMNL